jgi:hypothetical protein
MDILEFAKKLSAGKHHSARNDDVFIDRLNHRYTVTMIIIFAAIVTTQQYFGSPITCWVNYLIDILSINSFDLFRYLHNLQVVMKNMLMIYVG